MIVYKGRGLGDFYLQAYRDLCAHGRHVTVKGDECVEMPEPVTFTYEQPGHCWQFIPGRRFNPFFIMAEVVWILSGLGDIEWIAHYNKQMREYNDGGKNNHGAYGIRLRRYDVSDGFGQQCPVDQIKEVVRKLKVDPTTRQAVITLWDPRLDNQPSKDIPCNNWVGYTLRNGKLDQTVTIRSNDLVWGTPHNAVQFTYLQALVAGELNMDMGRFEYVVNNLHFYKNMYPAALGAVEEMAARTPAIGAEKMSTFFTILDKEVLCLKEYEEGLRTKSGKQLEQLVKLGKENRIHSQLDTFASCFLIWNYLKRHSNPNVEWGGALVHTLPDILRRLALDFYGNSTNPLYRSIR